MNPSPEPRLGLLHADDDRNVILSSQRYAERFPSLKSYAHRVKGPSPDEIVRMVEIHRPHVLIVDHRMGVELTSLEVLAALRERNLLRSRFAVLEGRFQEGTAVKVLSNGVRPEDRRLLFQAFQEGDLLGLNEKPDAFNFSAIYYRMQQLIQGLESGEVLDEKLVDELCEDTK